MYILILAMWAGTLAKGDSVSINSSEYTSLEKCEKAGQDATKTFNTMFKTVKFVCESK